MKYTFCNQYDMLLDEMSNLSSSVKVLVVSCLSNIIAEIGVGNDAKIRIERAMKILVQTFFNLVDQRDGDIRILVLECTPRKSQDYRNHSKFALVHWIHVYL